jgi:hypothetical protein
MNENRDGAGVYYNLFIPEYLLVKLLRLAEIHQVSSKAYLLAMIDAMIELDYRDNVVDAEL